VKRHRKTAFAILPARGEIAQAPGEVAALPVLGQQLLKQAGGVLDVRARPLEEIKTLAVASAQ